MRHLKRKLLLTGLLLAAAFCMAGCGDKGRLDEGDCECVFSFVDIPREFSLMDKETQEDFHIGILLRNINTEKYYSINLNQKNSFQETAHFHSGNFHIMSASAFLPGGITLDMETAKTDFSLSPDMGTTIIFSLKEPEAFTKNWMETQPMPEMLLADKFAREIQIDRGVVAFANLPRVLDLSDDARGENVGVVADPMVPAYGKRTLTDFERGISVTLLNPSDAPISYKECEVAEVSVYLNHAVMPGGLRLGQRTGKICSGDGSLYGSPDKFKGFPIVKWGIDSLDAIYSDAASGDCITLTLGNGGESIAEYRYELAVYRYE